MAERKSTDQPVTLEDVAQRLDTVARLLVCLINETKGADLAVSLLDGGMPPADVAVLLGMKPQAVYDARRKPARKGK